ncbi:hypothetical protein [Thermoplasma acidophilum]|uniref:Uncharacterized protein n=1 Tax=Thermoplasma acidophilum (strain ATCC 25905 / DSM 1728 / JCM 9062 / NBRC 15155 / AMRC-C165) TaxID=273075 RepID=Q9HIF1_THEAC|nr:hypothetical protein [Thermoplasma acidophilum]
MISSIGRPKEWSRNTIRISTAYGAYCSSRACIRYRGETPPDTSDSKKKYGILCHTDLGWIKSLKDSKIRNINFWSTRTTILDYPYEGMPFFFKTEKQRIEGYGNYVRLERLTPAEAWAMFGQGNGAPDLETLLSLLKKDGWEASDRNDGKITCFVLRDPVFFANPPSLLDCGISPFETTKYIDSIEGSTISGQIEEFAPLDIRYPSEVNGPVHSISTADGRPYQAELRNELFKIYRGKCAICG